MRTVKKKYPLIFLKCFDRVIGNEGKFTKNKKDPGNWTGGKCGNGELKGTKFGLSAASYPDLDIKNLTVEDAKKEYYQYFLNSKLDKFSLAMQYQMFDAAFNHGFKWASKILQRSLKVDDDGFIGVKTMLALNNKDVNDQLFLFIAHRQIFFTSLKHFKEFGRGWSRRIAQNLIYAAEDN